jgi:hypothetical protein
LRRCPGFEDAKRGDFDAAQYVVSRCAKKDRLDILRNRYPDAALIPVLGTNGLPLALAEAIGLPIWHRVRLLHTVSRKQLCAFKRLLHKPVFNGDIAKGRSYIIVDDIVTQGGTVAALREFIMSHGGKVVAVAALAYAIGSHNVAPQKWNIVRLTVKFGTKLPPLLREAGVAAVVRALTNSQAKYLLRFASVRNIQKRLPTA